MRCNMELSQKVENAIQRLKDFEPADGYFVCYSGGKDSDCIRILAHLAGVRYELHHNLTTVDAPETIRYVKSIPGVIIDKAKYTDGSLVTMWNLIVNKGRPPTRRVRYCCEVLKEHGGEDRFCVTGVRWSESLKRSARHYFEVLRKPVSNRKLADSMGLKYKLNQRGQIILNMDNGDARRFAEVCNRTSKRILNPILDWTESDVWEFLHFYGCASNPLYQCGQSRVGCIGCPLAGGRGMKQEFARYPKYKANFIRAFDRMVQVHGYAETSEIFTSGLAVYKWWVGDDPNQLSFFDEE